MKLLHQINRTSRPVSTGVEDKNSASVDRRTRSGTTVDCVHDSSSLIDVCSRTDRLIHGKGGEDGRRRRASSDIDWMTKGNVNAETCHLFRIFLIASPGMENILHLRIRWPSLCHFTVITLERQVTNKIFNSDVKRAGLLLIFYKRTKCSIARKKYFLYLKMASICISRDFGLFSFDVSSLSLAKIQSFEEPSLKRDRGRVIHDARKRQIRQRPFAIEKKRQFKAADVL